jgi:hypothetical protein
MSANQDHEAAIDRIADTSAELADMASAIGLESVVYILRMAEIEARKSIRSKRAPRKHAARLASAV